MNENLLQFIWQFRLYNNSKPLLTNEGKEAIVIHCGQHNKDAGPDFSEAKIKIGNTTWVGNIEIHLKSSDWKKHQHQTNKNYSNLILHVVYEHDEEIETENGASFPSIELKHYIDNTVLSTYENLMQQNEFIPCAKSIGKVREITIRQQLDRMLAERLEDKTKLIQDLLLRYNNNWQEVFYVQLARGFGIHINQDAFEQVALQTPLNLFAKHKNNLVQIEALLFGQAGFLHDYFDENYPILLRDEYMYLQKLHSLHGIDKKQWKFLRLRPANFPTIRLAQFAQLLHESTHLFSKITESKSVKELEKLFKFTVSDFWLNHYTFLEKSEERNKNLGKSFTHTLIINSIVPMLFIYGKLQGKEEFCLKAIDFLKEIPAEKNAQMSRWKELGIAIESAEDSQALLQLKKKYCDKKRCLECGIGFSILKKNEQATN